VNDGQTPSRSASNDHKRWRNGTGDLSEDPLSNEKAKKRLCDSSPSPRRQPQLLDHICRPNGALVEQTRPGVANISLSQFLRRVYLWTWVQQPDGRRWRSPITATKNHDAQASHFRSGGVSFVSGSGCLTGSTFFLVPEIVDCWGLGGRGGPETLPNGWGRKPPPFGSVFRAAGAAQTPKIDDVGDQKKR
jgi:hypothetical protein